ncbi:MAG: hypothetical protein ABW076_17255 [Candidatus Thiodiazotropha sp.]
MSEKNTSQVVTSSKASYIVFSRPEFVGAALTNTIVEFAPGAQGMILVTALRPQSKAIYKTTPGAHYFYMEGGENDDMIKIDTAPGRIYYVHTSVNMGLVAGRFYFKPLSYQSYEMKRAIPGKSCDEQFLNQYQFEPIHKDYDFSGGQEYDASSVGLTIECKKGLVSKAEISGMGLNELDEPGLLEMNETKDAYLKERADSFQSEILEDYPDWAKENFGGDSMGPDDGFPLSEVVKHRT